MVAESAEADVSVEDDRVEAEVGVEAVLWGL